MKNWITKILALRHCFPQRSKATKKELSIPEIKKVQLLSKLSGKTVRELESYSYYFKMSLDEMYDYYMCFKRLPEPDYVTVIRHVGVYNLIRAVQSGQLEQTENIWNK